MAVEMGTGIASSPDRVDRSFKSRLLGGPENAAIHPYGRQA